MQPLYFQRDTRLQPNHTGVVRTRRRQMSYVVVNREAALAGRLSLDFEAIE